MSTPTAADTPPASGEPDDGNAPGTAPNQGISAETPAEGDDDVPPEQPGSPRG